MPCSGYVTVEITSVGIPGGDNIQECIFVVVPESEYNNNPLPNGTYILNEL